MNYSNLLLDAVDIENFTVIDSLLVALIGILVVFAVLAIIIVLLWVQSKVFQNINSKKNKKSTTIVKPDVKVAETVKTNDDEIVAVISACVYTLLNEDDEVDSTAEFVIRKIEKVKRSN